METREEILNNIDNTIKNLEKFLEWLKRFKESEDLYSTNKTLKREYNRILWVMTFYLLNNNNIF